MISSLDMAIRPAVLIALPFSTCSAAYTFLRAVYMLCRPTEVYSFKGPSRMNRRDQKKGQQTAVVGRTPDGDLEVTVHWDEPNPGAVMIQQHNALKACGTCNSCVASPAKHRSFDLLSSSARK